MITLIVHLSDGDLFGQPIASAADARPTFEAIRAMLAESPLGLRAERFVFLTPENWEEE